MDDCLTAASIFSGSIMGNKVIEANATKTKRQLRHVQHVRLESSSSRSQRPVTDNRDRLLPGAGYVFRKIKPFRSFILRWIERTDVRERRLNQLITFAARRGEQDELSLANDRGVVNYATRSFVLECLTPRLGLPNLRPRRTINGYLLLR